MYVHTPWQELAVTKDGRDLPSGDGMGSWSARTVHFGGSLAVVLGKPGHEDVTDASRAGCSAAPEGSISVIAALNATHTSFATGEAATHAANHRCQANHMHWVHGWMEGGLVLPPMRKLGELCGWKRVEIMSRAPPRYRIFSFEAHRVEPQRGEVTDFAIEHWPSADVQRQALAFADVRYAIAAIKKDFGKPKKTGVTTKMPQKRANEHRQAMSNAMRLPPGMRKPVRLPDESQEDHAERVRAPISTQTPTATPQPNPKQVRIFKEKTEQRWQLERLRDREKGRAKALATGRAPAAVGTTFELLRSCQQGGEIYEPLRVVGFRTCVSGASDTRQVWLYDVSTLQEPPRVYESQDFSGGARVRRVLPPPRPPLTSESARAARYQTRLVAQVAGLGQGE